jgi:GNAT superfamily N-acetyltransferase
MAERRYALRVAGPADAEAVTALLRASYPALLASAYEADVLAATLPLMTTANPKLLASGTYYVADVDGGSLAGCGGWTPEKPGSGEIAPGVGHIRHFATHPAWTRRGIASALLVRCIEEAKARGIATLEAFATLSAEEFYRAHGFVPIGPIDVPMTPEIILPSLWMRRALV